MSSSAGNGSRPPAQADSASQPESTADGTARFESAQPPGSADPGAGATLLPAGGLSASASSISELRRRRLELAERVASLTWDLGGLAYEMAIRDHYRLDVLARKAAELQEADAELGELQRLLATAEAGVHGQCRSCGAVHSRGAAYCWHCGAPLLREARPAVLSVDNA
jgi:hypothetical protein